jgi:hypothetical protein
VSDTRRALRERIDADRARLVGFLQAFTRIDTANPPGDTRAGVAFIGNPFKFIICSEWAGADLRPVE